jgi:hypothetical protein
MGGGYTMQAAAIENEVRGSMEDGYTMQAAAIENEVLSSLCMRPGAA